MRKRSIGLAVVALILSGALPAIAEDAPANKYWYYCTSAKGYYPWVQSCPEGWRKLTTEEIWPSAAARTPASAEDDDLPHWSLSTSVNY